MTTTEGFSMMMSRKMLMEKQEDYLDAMEQKDEDDDEQNDEEHGDDSDEDGEHNLE